MKSVETRLQSIEDEILASTRESNADNTPRLKTLNMFDERMREKFLLLSEELRDRRRELQFLQTLLLKQIAWEENNRNQELIRETYSKQGDLNSSIWGFLCIQYIEMSFQLTLFLAFYQ